MISDRSKEAFSELFLQGVSETVGQNQGGYTWETKEFKNTADLKAKEFILLTMCSYDFRLFTTVHFTYSKTALNYVAERLGLPPDQVSREHFYDYMSEYGNLYCGGLKRYLGKIFPHIGMSTPDRLEQNSFEYFKDLHYAYEVFAVASTKDKLKLYFSMFVCPYRNLDFINPEQSKVEVTTGAMELF